MSRCRTPARRSAPAANTREASGKPRGPPSLQVLPSPREPMAVARAFLADGRRHSDGILTAAPLARRLVVVASSHWREWSHAPSAACCTTLRRTRSISTPKVGRARAAKPPPDRRCARRARLAVCCRPHRPAGMARWPLDRDHRRLRQRSAGRGVTRTAAARPELLQRRRGAVRLRRRARVPYQLARVPQEPVAEGLRARNTLAQWFGYVCPGGSTCRRSCSWSGRPRAGKGLIARILGA